MLNCIIAGPAILLSHTSSIFVKPKWIAKIYKQDIFLKK